MDSSKALSMMSVIKKSLSSHQINYKEDDKLITSCITYPEDENSYLRFFLDWDFSHDLEYDSVYGTGFDLNSEYMAKQFINEVEMPATVKIFLTNNDDLLGIRFQYQISDDTVSMLRNSDFCYALQEKYFENLVLHCDIFCRCIYRPLVKVVIGSISKNQALEIASENMKKIFNKFGRLK